MKAYVGVDVYIHISLTSALVRGQLHARYLSDWRLDGPQNRLGRHEEEKIFYPTGTRTANGMLLNP
jgi:hypothetical protein